MSDNAYIVTLSDCSASDIGTYNSEEQWGMDYSADRLEWQDVTIGDWGAAVNNVFSDLFLAGCRDPHKKLCELFFAVINTGFVPVALEKTLGAFVDFEMQDETKELIYKLTIECRKYAGSTPYGAGVATWWISEYLGDLDLLPKNVFLDSTHNYDGVYYLHHDGEDYYDAPELMGENVLQWDFATTYLPEVEHPFARKICEISHQLRGVRVCSRDIAGCV